MKWVLSVQHAGDAGVALASPCDEIVLGCRDFSRFGQLDWQTCISLARQAKQNSKKAIFAWDVLMTERQLDCLSGKLENADTECFSAVRVQDLGALSWPQRHRPQMDIHLLLEHGGHNLKAIRGWAARVGEQLKRIVFSPQIPLERLEGFIALGRSLGVETELMVLGPLLLFSSPRKLLAAYGEEGSAEDSPLTLLGDSLESPHKNFELVENAWGTFMFHPKDLGLVYALRKLCDAGLSAVRFDLFEFSKAQHKCSRPINLISKIRRAFEDGGDCETLQNLLGQEYPRPFIKGLFGANKSGQLFGKLKNQHIAERGPRFVGSVVEVAKKAHVAIYVRDSRRPLRLGDRLEYRTPEGRIREGKVLWLKDSSGRDLSECHQGSLAVLNPVSGISVKTAVYWQNPQGD